MKVYVSGPLFTEKQREQNIEVKKALEREGFRVFLPQDLGVKNVDEGCRLFEGDYYNLIDSDILVIVLDGPEIDSGAAAEAGIFFESHKGNKNKAPIIGFTTDERFKGKDGNKVNAFVLGLLSQDICFSLGELAKAAKTHKKTD